MYEAVGIWLPGSFIGSANEKAAGKARISAAQDNGAENKATQKCISLKFPGCERGFNDRNDSLC